MGGNIYSIFTRISTLREQTKSLLILSVSLTESAQGGRGYVRGIRYINITLDNAGKPINIDQQYCPEGNCNPSVSDNLISL